MIDPRMLTRDQTEVIYPYSHDASASLVPVGRDIRGEEFSDAELDALMDAPTVEVDGPPLSIWSSLTVNKKHAENYQALVSSGQLTRAREYAELVSLDLAEVVPGVSIIDMSDEDQAVIEAAMTPVQEWLANHPDEAQALAEREAAYFAKTAGDPLYIDVAALLAGNLELPAPTVGVRSDREPFIYDGRVNVLFGPPETGKTLALSAIAADVIFAGGNVLWIDLDHNGAVATVARFRSFGVSVEVLSDPARFRLALPESKEEVLNVVKDAARWKPTLVALDSIGELLPMFGANSNSDDDYTAVHRAVLTKMAVAGVAVVAIDHEAKGQSSAAFGAGGAVAKKRAIDGVMLRATLRLPFTPGKGGKAALSIVKDRAGGVRAVSPANGDKEPLMALFELISDGDAIDWKFWAPEGATPRAAVSDLDTLLALEPAPHSIYEVKNRLGWGSRRASVAYKLFVETSNFQ